MSSSWDATADGKTSEEVYYEYQDTQFLQEHCPKGLVLKHTCVVPVHWSDRNCLKCFFQKVQQTGADHHLLWQGLEGHPGIQLGRLYPSTALTFSCKDT